MIRTLVVDDDYHVAHAHALSVGRLPGFSVVGEARSAEEARLIIKDERPDLLLLDMYLPDYNGLDLVRRLTRESARSADSDGPSHVPDFLLVTAARDIESVRSAMQLGAVYYLVKPFTFAALREQLESYRQWRQRLERSNEADQGTVDALYGLLRSPAVTSATRRNLPTTMARVLDIVQSSATPLGAAEDCRPSRGEPSDGATLPRDAGPEAGDRPRPRLPHYRATRAPLPVPLTSSLTGRAEVSARVRSRSMGAVVSSVPTRAFRSRGVLVTGAMRCPPLPSRPSSMQPNHASPIETRHPDARQEGPTVGSEPHPCPTVVHRG